MQLGEGDHPRWGHRHRKGRAVEHEHKRRHGGNHDNRSLNTCSPLNCRIPALTVALSAKFRLTALCEVSQPGIRPQCVTFQS